MSEVIRYLASYTPYEGLDLNGQCARHDGDYFVSAADFDRVTAERDALAQNLKFAEEGSQSFSEECDALQQRLTAADERADVLEGLLKSGSSPTYAHCAAVMEALKPAEGGGDHVKHYECIGKGGDYTVVAIAQGAGTLKGFNHYVYKNADGVHFVRDPEDFLSRMQIRP